MFVKLKFFVCVFDLLFKFCDCCSFEILSIVMFSIFSDLECVLGGEIFAFYFERVLNDVKQFFTEIFVTFSTIIFSVCDDFERVILGVGKFSDDFKFFFSLFSLLFFAVLLLAIALTRHVFSKRTPTQLCNSVCGIQIRYQCRCPCTCIYLNGTDWLLNRMIGFVKMYGLVWIVLLALGWLFFL